MNEPIARAQFTELFPELLAHPECHQLILHLLNQKNWPLPVELEQFVAALDGEPRRCAEFILANAEDPGFLFRAQALETTTLKVEAECGAESRDPPHSPE